jgi:hypothetical protein
MFCSACGSTPALTGEVHKALLSGFAKAMTAEQIASLRQSLLRDNVIPATLRDAFFDAQARALSVAYADNVTTLCNSEGDYTALEAEHPGLGFAALEAYRHHLMCHQDRVIAIQRNQTLGMWAAFQARLALGQHEPESWEHVSSGAALERNLYNATDDRHRLRGLGRGVLDLGVVWNYDRRRTSPIAEIRHARVQGVQPELKAMLKEAPLSEFNLPVIVQGKVMFDSYAPNNERQQTSQLRIARNEGGAITLGAKAGTKSAEMLADLGQGDAYAGARALFAYVDGLTLTSIE